MKFFFGRRGIGILLLAVAVTSAGVWFFLFRPKTDMPEYWSVFAEWQGLGSDANEAQSERVAEHSLKVGRKYPGTEGGLSALLLAATDAPDTSGGKEAQLELVKQIDIADMGQLAKAFDRTGSEIVAIQHLAPTLLARARKSPDHPKTGRLLSAVCLITGSGDRAAPLAPFAEAADLIADRYAETPDIVHFCEVLGGRGVPPPWAGRFERHLRAVVQANRDRFVRCSAQFALASVLQSAGEDRQAEAQTLFESFCAEYDGKQAYRGQTIEQSYYKDAQKQLNELRFRAVGMPAPDITGPDLDGKPLRISDYRGRVVLLSFWGTWCFPCMKLIPHEIELVAQFRDQPFDIVGVNCDSDPQKARDAVLRTKMSWRSFRDQVDDKPTIAKQWKILGFPTLYLIDHHGIIRKRWIGSPTPEELLQLSKVLVDAARRKVPQSGMRALVAAVSQAPAAIPPVPADPSVTKPAHPGTGFQEKIYQAADGSESKYALFVPRTYDGATAVPAMLYLHGSGSRGSDGRSLLRNGLANAIKKKNEDFPFLVIFPQAREDESWLADSAGGKRAVAILNQVQKDYRIDASRLTLTGLSMGGQGTWSLAAADPKRWSAIVPISHGGNPATAPRLKDVPCWCFHGDADDMVPVSQSREMIQAIKDAGGRPLYHELIGVNHNSCADRVFAMPDLYEWILQQNSGNR
jgi:thiol-disulfide isomerase/thioredoxin/predicted esterase